MNLPFNEHWRSHAWHRCHSENTLHFLNNANHSLIEQGGEAVQGHHNLHLIQLKNRLHLLTICKVFSERHLFRVSTPYVFTKQQGSPSVWNLVASCNYCKWGCLLQRFPTSRKTGQIWHTHLTDLTAGGILHTLSVAALHHI